VEQTKRKVILVKVIVREFDGTKYYKARCIDGQEVYDMNVNNDLIANRPNLLELVTCPAELSYTITAGQFNRATPTVQGIVALEQ